MTSGGSYYDIILDDKGKLYRLQVKGSMKPKEPPYQYKFNVLAQRTHTNFDLLAYVAIDQKKIGYEVVPNVNHRFVSVNKLESMTIAKAIADFNASKEISLELNGTPHSER